MSFSQDVKNELLKAEPKEVHCLRAELFGVLAKDMETRPEKTPYEKDCCKRAFLRGIFLAAGSISDPYRAYNLEFSVNTPWLANEIQKLLFSYEIKGKIVMRNGKIVVYVKDGECIADFLKVVQANLSVFNYEEARVYKNVRNRVNRNVNCEAANMHKTAMAMKNTLADIEKLKARGKFEKLPEQLKEIVRVRLENPEATLEELGTFLEPPVGKSGVNHRLRRLHEIAEEEV